MFKKITMLVVLLLVAVLGLGSIITSANATKVEPGSTPGAPIVVDSPDDVPEGAVQTGQTTGSNCETSTFWTLTVPATEDTSHQEFRYKRDVPAQEEVSHQEWRVKERTRELVPAQEETSHLVYSYKKKVVDYKTQYHFRKYTQTKEGKKVNGTVVYGPYGPWTAWEPETHTSWEDSNAPLGSPEFHGEGKNGNTYWYRVWQAQADGQTRQVENGSHFEFSGETTDQLGEPWKLLPGYPKKVVDSEATEAYYTEWSGWELTQDNLLQEPVVPADTDVHEYKVIGPMTFVDSEYVPSYTEYFVLGGEPSLNEADASWINPLVTGYPEVSWVQFDERTVSHEDGTPEEVVYYAYHDGVKCDKPEKPEEPKEPREPKKHTPAKPEVPFVIDAGL